MDYNPKLQSIILGNSSQEFKKLHITPIGKSIGKQMDPYFLVAYTQTSLLLRGLGVSLGVDSAHSGLCLHTSISNKDNHIHRHIHRLI